MEQKEQHDWVSLQNDIGKTPLHLAAGQGWVLVYGFMDRDNGSKI